MEKERRKVVCYALIILCIYIGLPTFILVGILPFDFKFYFLTISAVLTCAFARGLGTSNTEMGITKINCKKSIVTVLPITIIFALAGIVIWVLGYSRIVPNESMYFFVFYILMSSPVQEFLYRGVIPGMLNKMNYGYHVQLIVSSILYSFVHIIYKDWITLVLTLIIGIVWFISYKKSNNILGVSISHAVLGIVTILAGIID